jgi:hypothetical protein
LSPPLSWARTAQVVSKKKAAAGSRNRSGELGFLGLSMFIKTLVGADEIVVLWCGKVKKFQP